MPEDKEDKVIDIPTDGPGAEVTLPEEPVTEGAQIVDVPAEKPEGEVEIKDEPKKEEASKEQPNTPNTCLLYTSDAADE